MKWTAVALSMIVVVGLLISGISVPVAAVNVSPSSNSAAKAAGRVSTNQAIAPEGTQPSNATVPTFPNFPSWREYVAKVPTPSAGCFSAKYPNLVWQRTKCGPPASGHESPSRTPTTLSARSEQVGNGNDWVAQSPGTLIATAIGSFPSVTGLTSETDTGQGDNSYSLQMNSQGGAPGQGFPVNSPYSDTAGVTGWEQFIYQSTPSGGSVWIEYWLMGYSAVNCPGTAGGCCANIPSPPGGGTGWIPDIKPTDYGGDCYDNPAVASAPYEQPTSLWSEMLIAHANDANGDDDAIFCAPNVASCYTFSNPTNILNLYEQWTLAEFGVFGYIGASQANFNPETTITVTNTLEDQSGNNISPVTPCPNNGQTGETNNLDLGSCSLSLINGASSAMEMVFVESNVAPQTLTTSVYSGSGSISPDCSSGCPEAFGSSVAVTANPSPGWQFSYWTQPSGSIALTSCFPVYGVSPNPCTFSMPSNDVTLGATFTQIMTLTTNVDSGQGSVSPDCSGGCSETVGSSQTVQANPDSG